MELKLVDFEDVNLAGSLIAKDRVKLFTGDLRYYLDTCTIDGEGNHFANTNTNKFFLFALKAYLEKYFRSSKRALKFQTFMRTSSEKMYFPLHPSTA